MKVPAISGGKDGIGKATQPGHVMKVLAIINGKGGVGKTTVSTHLAIAAERLGLIVAVLDLDPQPSSAMWHGDRNAIGAQPSPSVIACSAAELPLRIRQAREQEADLRLRYPAARGRGGTRGREIRRRHPYPDPAEADRRQGAAANHPACACVEEAVLRRAQQRAGPGSGGGRSDRQPCQPRDRGCPLHPAQPEGVLFPHAAGRDSGGFRPRREGGGGDFGACSLGSGACRFVYK